MTATLLAISAAYVVIGVLLLAIGLYSRFSWWVKAAAIVVTSAFFIEVFFATKGLLGWPQSGALPARFQLLWVRVVEPDRKAADPGAIYLWVEALDDGNRPSGVPRAYRLPYRDALAEKTDKAISEIAAGRAQGGRAADLGSGQGGLLEAVREYITPNTIMETSGGDPSTGGGLMAPRAGDEVSFTPLLPPRMPPKDVQY